MRKAETAELILSSLKLDQRCKTLATELARVLGLAVGETSFTLEVASEVAIVALGGRVSEVINRNCGGSHRVVPLCAISGDVLAWAGYREKWGKRGNELGFRFAEAGFTVHIGRIGELAKPQVMRSEWVSRRSKSFAEHAGHPHWQIDVLETVRKDVQSAPATFGQTSQFPTEFTAPDLSPIGFLHRLTLEHMHLASAANWWQHPPQPIAHAPVSVADLDRWMLGCIAYLRQEIGRCGLSNLP